MSDTTHPMLRLLGLTDLRVFLVKDNFQFFTKLEAALIEDEQPVLDFGDYEATFNQTVSDTADLFQNQTEVLHAMIEGWSISVMQPMIDELKQYNDSSNITLSLDGDLISANLNLEGVDGFVDGLGAVDVADIKAIINKWSHSSGLIDNLYELEDALEIIKNK